MAGRAIQGVRLHGRGSERLDPLLTISFESFSNVWFWIIISVAWSVTCHITLGVPYDMLTRGDSSEQAAADIDTLAHVQARRAISFFEGSTTRVVGVMILTFLLAVIGTFGFYYSYELAAAAFVLIVPLLFVQFLNLRLAFRIEREGLFGEVLRRALLRRRFWNQVIGLISIVIVAGVAFLTFARNFAIWY